LPESTVFYAAFPNYGDVAHQTLKIFRDELQQSPVLRDWWQHGELATAAPKIEDSLEKLYQFHEYLSDEIVVSGTIEGRNPSLVFVAEIHKPGLKNFLQETIDHFAGKSKLGVRVLDLQELAATKDQGIGKSSSFWYAPTLWSQLPISPLCAVSARTWTSMARHDFSPLPSGSASCRNTQAASPY
jgi:hypothetical protein